MFGVWFLGQMPCSEFQDATEEEEEDERQQKVKADENENLGDENGLKKAAAGLSLKTTIVSEEIEDWELLENEVPSKGE